MSADRSLTVKLDRCQLELVRIPPGRFLMGSTADELDSRENERPAHLVAVSPFCMGVYPVTQLQWSCVMERPLKLPPDFTSEAFPAVNVWFADASEFCARLASQTGLPFRLPSEAEWEYACRAGTQTPFYWGHEISGGNVNYKLKARSTDHYVIGLGPVGFSGVSNAFGLFDMHGNVWEWCSDTWHDDYFGAPTDGSAWTIDGDAGYHVQHGGSWADNATVCRSAFRVGDVAHNRDYIVGLRVCLTAG